MSTPITLHAIEAPRLRPAYIEGALPNLNPARAAVVAFEEGMKRLGLRDEPRLRYCKPNHICIGLYVPRDGWHPPEVWIQYNLGPRHATHTVFHELTHHMQMERDGFFTGTNDQHEAEADATAARLTIDLIERGLIPGYVL